MGEWWMRGRASWENVCMICSVYTVKCRASRGPLLFTALHIGVRMHDDMYVPRSNHLYIWPAHPKLSSALAPPSRSLAPGKLPRLRYVS